MNYSGVNDNIWEKLPQESAKSFGAFKVYRDLPVPERSLKRTCEEFYGEWSAGKMRQVQTWSAQYAWVNRINAWDEYLDSKSREEHVKQVTEMKDRQLQIAKALQQKAIARLKTIKPEDLDPDQVLAYFNLGVTLERKILGEPDEIKKNDIMLEIVDFSRLSDGEIQRMLARKMTNILDITYPQLEPGEPSE